MSEAIRILMSEHRAIERVLSSLETFVRGLESGDAEEQRRALRDYGRFFGEFADRCHHAKEEDRLFVEMTRNGFPREEGPIAVMLMEHDEGRGHVGALRAAGERQGPLTPEERDSVRLNALAYISMLRAHIMKEDNVLYPMAERVLAGDAMGRLASEFEAQEREIMGQGTHEELHGLADRLAARYPPSGVASFGGCGSGCGGSFQPWER